MTTINRQLMAGMTGLTVCAAALLAISLFTPGAFAAGRIINPRMVESQRMTFEARRSNIETEIATIQDPTIVGTKLPAQNAEIEGKAFVESERSIAAALSASESAMNR